MTGYFERKIQKSIDFQQCLICEPKRPIDRPIHEIEN